MSPPVRSEAARQRELYRYWQPNESVFPSAEYDETFNRDYQPRPSYDSALTAYAQLGALRCNVKRAMISVVDQNYQYIIAEGTKTLSLQNGTVIDQDDQLWFGLRTIQRSVGICARALGQFTEGESHDGAISEKLFEPLQFIIPDLSKDPRFENQPFVCGTPYLRFYAGVPIRSPAGYIIGIYSVVDDKPRNDFGEGDLDILRDLAATVMDHLVLGTVRGRHHRADKMVKGLGLFIEGKATLRDWWLRSGYLAQGPTTSDGSRGGWTLKARADAEFGPQKHNVSNDHTPKRQNGFTSKSIESKPSEMATTSSGLIDAALFSSPNAAHSSHSAKPGFINPSNIGHISKNEVDLPDDHKSISSDSTSLEEDDSSKETATETVTMPHDMAAMFKRASNLIRESINLEGCVILDANGAIIENIEDGPDTREGESASEHTSPEPNSTNVKEGLTWNIVHGKKEHGRKPLSSRSESLLQGSMCEVLGYSSKFDIHPDDGQATTDFQFPQNTFHRLLKRYPNGSILNFELNGNVSSGEEELNTGLMNNATLHEINFKRRNQVERQRFKEVDNQIIMETFPGVRRLAFFPLWDTNAKTCFCGILAWTNDPLRILDADDDMAYLAAFGNSIMAEMARIDASMVDRMKSNFISTVSHELRSPLHGILASTEFLNDMSVSTAQMNVIRMINICGRTLLDTINHILDFTELNRLRKSNLSEKMKRGDQDVSKWQHHQPFNLLKQTAKLDLSLLVEEVVDSTLAGHDFGQSNLQAKLKAHSQSSHFDMQSSSLTNDVPGGANGNVKVIMDIDWQMNWEFSLQPGAWRRIVMNLFGNAVKYTKHGYVCVSLKSMNNVSNQDGRPMAILTVSDTGKGISKKFLKHHVFKPFWQEDSLATGTGLGLSIVQQIVRDLGGHIEISSKEGTGTKVTVQMPFELPTATPTPALKHINDDDMYLTVSRKMNGLKVYIISSSISPASAEHGASQTPEIDEASFLSLKQSLCKTLKDWFKVEIVEAPSINSADADVFLLLTDELSTLGEQNCDDSFLWNPEVSRLAETNSLIVLCTTPVSLSMKASIMQKANHLIQQPFGPHKLANAFDTFLKRKAVPTRPCFSQHNSITTHQFPLRDVPIVSTVTSLSISNTERTTSAVDLSTTINHSSITTNAVIDASAQLPDPSQSFTVLLVEDNEINLKLLTMYMRKLNKPYQTAINGLEAVQAFKKDPLSLRLILMDITMPIMDGLTATQEIRKYERELGIPPATIVALTGASSVNAREQAIASGLDQFFTKPVPLKVVRSLVVDWKQQSIEDHRQRLHRNRGSASSLNIAS